MIDPHGTLLVIPIRVKGGKTTAAENLAIYKADRLRQSVLYVDSERPRWNFERSCADKLRGSDVDVSTLPLYFCSTLDYWADESFDATLGLIRRWSSSLESKNRPCVIWDYLRIHSQTMGDMLEALTDLVHELGISMIVMTQPNRSGRTTPTT